MVSHPQKDDRTHPNSHTTYSCLTPAEMQKRLRLHEEFKHTKLQLSYLQKISENISEGVLLIQTLMII